jgi:hypothetical protein
VAAVDIDQIEIDQIETKEALNQLVFENAASLYKIPVILPPIQTDLGRFGNAIAISEPAVMKMPALPALSGRRPVRFAPDSPLEGDGFEPSVPRLRRNSARLAGRDATRVRNTIVRVRPARARERRPVSSPPGGVNIVHLDRQSGTRCSGSRLRSRR